MNLTEAAKKRTSRRKFIEMPIEPSALKHLLSLVDSFNSESGLSISFVADGSLAFKNMSRSMGWFKGVNALFAMKGHKNDRHLFEKVGYYGERLVLEAGMLDISSCWVGSSFNRDVKICDLDVDELLVLVIAVGYTERNKSFIEKMMTGSDERKSKSLAELLRCDAQPPNWVLDGMEYVKIAPSANNNQPVVFDYKHGQLTAGVLNSMGFDLVDMGIAKLHFELIGNGKFEIGNFGRYVINENEKEL